MVTTDFPNVGYENAYDYFKKKLEAYSTYAAFFMLTADCAHIYPAGISQQDCYKNYKSDCNTNRCLTGFNDQSKVFVILIVWPVTTVFRVPSFGEDWYIDNILFDSKGHSNNCAQILSGDTYSAMMLCMRASDGKSKHWYSNKMDYYHLEGNFRGCNRDKCGKQTVEFYQCKRGADKCFYENKYFNIFDFSVKN